MWKCLLGGPVPIIVRQNKKIKKKFLNFPIFGHLVFHFIGYFLEFKNLIKLYNLKYIINKI